MSGIQLSPLASITTSFLVMFVRNCLNREWNFLQRYLIPEPVSGGLPVALLQELMLALRATVDLSDGNRSERN